MKNSSDVRLGIIGLGVMGTLHANNVQKGLIPQLKLCAVADVDATRLEAFADIPRFESAEALIESGEVDAVLVSTPHYSHTTIGITALKAGLHVMVEKPISVHKADCESLIAAYDPSSSQVFAAMFNQRTDPRYIKLKQLMADGTLGALQRINWVITNWFRTEEYYRSGDWRATWGGEGGGVLLNQCPHQLDLYQWLFGMPERVYARCQFGRFHEIEVEDSVTAVLEYGSGVQGVFITTTGEAPGVNRLEVVGENGIVTIDDDDGLKFRRNVISSVEFSKTTSERFANPEVWEVVIPTKGRGEQHIGILKNFTNTIQGKETLIAPATEGIHSVELANSMILSGIRDQAIGLPLDAGEYASMLKGKIEGSTFTKQKAQAPGASVDMSKSF